MNNLIKKLKELDPEYDFCIDCKDFGEPNGCNMKNGPCRNYELFNEMYEYIMENNKEEFSNNIILCTKCGKYTPAKEVSITFDVCEGGEGRYRAHCPSCNAVITTCGEAQ